ncbi:MAG TPA: hypothetical protein VFG19_16400 [Geobacteraceae bacterium]|nr:hypothetical protein [Geobacteraceae bacterium]
MRYLIIYASTMLLLHLFGGAAFAVTQEEIRSAVETRCKITKPGFLGDYKEIGSVLVVRKEGLRANRPSASFSPNVITNGGAATAGGGDLPPGGNADGVLKTGDRLYLYGVRTGNDFVQLDLFTVRTFIVTGTRGPTPLQASVRYRYDEGLAGVTSKQVMEDIGAWFRIEGGAGADRETEQDGGNGPGGGPAATRTVNLGQSQQEVTAILGEPEKKILLGKKAVFVYRDLKVVFIDGKVADAY